MKKALFYAGQKSACVCYFDTLELVSESFDDGDQDDGADERNDETREIETTDSAEAEVTSQPASQDGSDDSYDDIENNALLGIGIHEKRCGPSDEASENDIGDKTHMFCDNNYDLRLREATS